LRRFEVCSNASTPRRSSVARPKADRTDDAICVRQRQDDERRRDAGRREDVRGGGIDDAHQHRHLGGRKLLDLAPPHARLALGRQPAVEDEVEAARRVAERERRLAGEARHEHLEQARSRHLGVERRAELAAGMRKEMRAASVLLGDMARRLGCSERHPLVGAAAQAPLRQVQVDEDLHLGAQHVGIDRREDVVDRAERVAEAGLHLVGVRGDEDDRRARRSLVLADQLGGLEAVDVGHVDVEQDRRELGLEDLLQRLRARAGADQVVAEVLENGLEDEELLRQVVDDENAGALAIVFAEVVEFRVQRHNQPLRTARRFIGSTGFDR
jgi:hypothetical protein